MYASLADSNEIRLLYLQPSLGDCPIECRLLHAKLSDGPHYEALSYMWGPKDYRSILVNGVVTEIRENLYEALLHLRHQRQSNESEERILWIDALCINQNDLNERNHQVAQMGAIYKQATHTVIWLGLADPTTHDAVSFLIKYGQMKNPWWAYQKFFDDTAITEENIRILRAVEAICLKEYWSRLWIIQEILLVAEIQVQYGKWSFNMAYLGLFFSVLSDLNPKIDSDLNLARVNLQDSHSPDLLTVLDDNKTIINGIKNSNTGKLVMDWKSKDRQPFALGQGAYQPSPLVHLCIKYAKAGCEERRDKIFGFIGIALPCCSTAVPIDYSSPFAEICCRVLYHHLVQHKRRGFLLEAWSFHTQVDFNPTDCIVDLLDREELSPKVASIGVGHSGHAISYISPPLNSNLYGSSFVIPNLSLSFWQKFEQIRNVGGTDGNKFPRFTTEIVLAFPLANFEGRTSDMDNFLFSKHPDFGVVDLKFERHLQDMTSPSPFEIYFKQLLLDFQNHRSASKFSYVHQMLAIQEPGLICLVPSNTELGDVICGIEEPGVLLIVRQAKKDSNKHHLIGRAVSIFSRTAVLPPVSKQRICRVTAFNLENSALQLITAASTVPDPDFLDSPSRRSSFAESSNNPNQSQVGNLSGTFSSTHHSFNFPQENVTSNSLPAQKRPIEQLKSRAARYISLLPRRPK